MIGQPEEQETCVRMGSDGTMKCRVSFFSETERIGSANIGLGSERLGVVEATCGLSSLDTLSELDTAINLMSWQSYCLGRDGGEGWTSRAGYFDPILAIGAGFDG